MQKKLLIVGGSHADIPIILSAQKLGLWVITTGNNPQDLGHSYADEYHPEDYSQPKKIFALAIQIQIDAICASSNDFSALSCAYVAEKLHLSGHDTFETSQIIHHKDKFRTFALAHKLSVPQTIDYNEQHSHTLNYPLIVKPVDLSGGKGIKKVYNKEELHLAITEAKEVSKSHSIVIEEFIEGSNHGYSTFLKEGKIVFAFMDDEHYFHNPYLVSGASTSLQYTKEIAKKLNTELEQIAQILQLVDGLFHVQFILRDNQPYIIEICRRTPGDLYVKFVEYATGFNMSEAIVKSVLNQNINSYTIKTISYISRHCVMATKQGYIQDVSYSDLSSNIFDKMVFYTSGDFIQDPLTYKAEINFIVFNSQKEMKKRISELNDLIYIKQSIK